MELIRVWCLFLNIWQEFKLLYPLFLIMKHNKIMRMMSFTRQHVSVIVWGRWLPRLYHITWANQEMTFFSSSLGLTFVFVQSISSEAFSKSCFEFRASAVQLWNTWYAWKERQDCSSSSHVNRSDWKLDVYTMHVSSAIHTKLQWDHNGAFKCYLLTCVQNT